MPMITWQRRGIAPQLCSPSYPPDKISRRPYERYGGDPRPASLGPPDPGGCTVDQIGPGTDCQTNLNGSRGEQSDPFDGMRIHRSPLPGASLLMLFSISRLITSLTGSARVREVRIFSGRVGPARIPRRSIRRVWPDGVARRWKDHLPAVVDAPPGAPPEEPPGDPESTASTTSRAGLTSTSVKAACGASGTSPASRGS